MIIRDQEHTEEVQVAWGHKVMLSLGYFEGEVYWGHPSGNMQQAFGYLGLKWGRD